MPYSRNAKYCSTRLPKQRKTIPLAGTGDDRGTYFRCWNCGTINKITRERVDTSARARGGTTIDEFIDTSPANYTGDFSITPTADSPWWNYEVLMSQGPDLVNLSPYYNRMPEVYKGCWFCGCTTWRG